MSEIINVCASLGIQLLIEIPDDIAVFAEIKNNLFGHPIHSPPIASKVILSPGDPTTRKLLCVPASSAKLTLKLNKIQMHQFMHAAVFSEAKERFYNLTPKDFYRCENEAARNRAMQVEKYDCSLYNSPLAQREIPDSTIESSSFLAAGKAITIKPKDLIITKHDLNEIHKTINNKTKQAEKYPNYGGFRLGPWTSPMLAHLNEASTLFVSSLPPEATKDTVFATLEEINKWLTNEWGETAGELLINESSKTILPNAHSNPNYSEIIKNISLIKSENTEILEQLIINDYASDALTAINIAAIYLHKLKDTETISNDRALEILENSFGFRGRLIQAVSTIIRHNSRANKRLTK
ncbi:hypothetical protein [Ectopseudomonas oleovorans]|uniref:hypothetical protein n=1 Tax=Ectopseudomonas oleovorans TaxID=301 RepID=UPI0011B21683|nr:hypothetical protein [Pseudomonas indoloxydans]